jgi:hypothetical protein
MNDRLRRLDALFAEKVLGLAITVMPTKSVYTDTWERLPFISLPECPMLELPRYTRSLDAAWDGALAIAKRDIGLLFEKTHSEPYYAAIDSHPKKKDWKGGAAAHPAEALVLACLRAVGCKEEELKS